MSTRVHDPVNAHIGELVSMMSMRACHHANVSEVIDERKGRLTNTAYALVAATSPGVAYDNVWTVRDDIGSLIEVPEPVCIHCEETIECKCYPETV